MDSYVDSKTDKRAYIMPIALLLLCLVALTCCAYAYYTVSELEVKNNELNGKYYEIDYTDDAGVSITDKIDELELSFYTGISIVDGARTFTVHSNPDTIVRDFYVTLHTDMDRTFTVLATADMGDVLSQIVTVGSIAYDVDNTAVNDGDTVKITVTFDVANVDFKTVTGITPNGNGISDLATMQTAISDFCSNTYDVSVTAQPN